MKIETQTGDAHFKNRVLKFRQIEKNASRGLVEENKDMHEEMKLRAAEQK